MDWSPLRTGDYALLAVQEQADILDGHQQKMLGCDNLEHWRTLAEVPIVLLDQQPFSDLG